VGAIIARHLHREGFNLIVHYRRSRAEAERLAEELMADRPGSVALVGGDLAQSGQAPALVQEAARPWGRLDVLVNNASSFYPTALGEVREEQWEDLLGSNLKGPFFLTQAAAPYLRDVGGAVVNLADVYADRPLKGFPVYSIAKAGVVMMTKTLARELAPAVRVNAVAPGAVLWPEGRTSEATQAAIISRTALKRQGEPEDIARAVLFFIRDAPFVTGQILAVDGGRTLTN
jgi:pteridine reductase